MGSKSDFLEVIRVYWSLLLGNVVEWYEFAVYGYLAEHVERNFFEGSEIGVWLGFGVTFLARPIGGLVMGVLGDRFGRSFAVNISILGMLVGTCGQGCLPTFVTSGRALGTFGLVCLVMLRFLQGLSAAGEISTISTYLTEVGSHCSLCRVMSLIAITANVGFLSAKATVFTVQAVFGVVAMEQWAWRLPFILALLPGLVAVWGRRNIPESGMFLEEKSGHEGSAQKLVVVFRSHWRSVLIGAGSVSCFAILQYGCFVWGQSFLRQVGMSQDSRMIVDLVARGVQIALALPVGWLADKLGIGSVMLVGSLGVLLSALPLWARLASDPTDLLTVGLASGVGFGVLGSLTGTLPFYFVVELFPTAVRNTATGISYNLGFSLFGGLAPIVAQAAFEASVFGPGFLFMVGGLASSVSIFVGLLLQRHNLLTMAHIRKEPYLWLCDGTAVESPANPSDEAKAVETGATPNVCIAQVEGHISSGVMVSV